MESLKVVRTPSRGTTSERAQETLDVTLSEIERLSEGIHDDELERCMARAKSTLVMQQESTGARAGALARDWFHLGRVVPLEEIRNKIDALTAEQVGSYARSHPPRLTKRSALCTAPGPTTRARNSRACPGVAGGDSTWREKVPISTELWQLFVAPSSSNTVRPTS